MRLCLLLICVDLHAAVIGASAPAQSITAARILQLPKAQQAGWFDYLARSEQEMSIDRATLAAELKATGLAEPLMPPSSSAAKSMPLNKGAEWYATADAIRIADSIVSFQTPAGGWSKNLNVADHARRRGESYAPDNVSKHLSPGDFDTPSDPHWNYVGTLDNDATTSELQFLGLVLAQRENAAYQTSFLRGIDYLFASQFPNGGWPQVWPLEGGYHDAITYNDGAVTQTLEFLEAVAEGKYSFVPAGIAKRAAASVARGIDCIVESQIRVNGRRTVWGQQHDPLTLQPVSGRNYEPAAQCSSESAGMAMFLMNLPHPSPPVVAAVDAAIAWLKQTEIHGKMYVKTSTGAHIEDSATAPPIWARYYEIGTNRPIFGDRDKSIHDQLSELSEERLRGYSWYNGVPQKALDRYAVWH
jgi:PelA/Pel-15E family pectate lyase